MGPLWFALRVKARLLVGQRYFECSKLAQVGSKASFNRDPEEFAGAGSPFLSNLAQRTPAASGVRRARYRWCRG